MSRKLNLPQAGVLISNALFPAFAEAVEVDETGGLDAVGGAEAFEEAVGRNQVSVERGEF